MDNPSPGSIYTFVWSAAGDLVLEAGTVIAQVEGNDVQLGSLNFQDILVIQTGAGQEIKNLEIRVAGVKCAFHLGHSGHYIHLTITHGSVPIGSRFSLGVEVTELDFNNVDHTDPTPAPLPTFRNLEATDFDWDFVIANKGPLETNLHDSKAHFFLAGTISDVFEVVAETEALVFASGVDIGGQMIDLEKVRLAKFQADMDNQLYSRCYIAAGNVNTTTFRKPESGSPILVELEVYEQEDATTQKIDFRPSSGTTPSHEANVTFFVAAPVFNPGATNRVHLDLDIGTPINIASATTYFFRGLTFAFDTQTHEVETENFFIKAENEPGLIVKGAGSVLFKNCIVESDDPTKRVVCRVEDTASVEFKGTGTDEGVPLYFVSSQLHLKLSKGATVSFDRARLNSYSGAELQPGEREIGELADYGDFALILESLNTPEAGDELVVQFKGEKSLMVCHRATSNGILIDAKGGKTPIRLETTAGGLGASRTYEVQANTILRNVGVLFRDSAHFEAMDIDATDLANSNSDSTFLGSLVFGTQATCVDAQNKLNFKTILDASSSSVPIWISRKRHVMTSWKTDEPFAFVRDWKDGTKTLRILKDVQTDAEVPMRLDAAFAVGLADGTSFTGKDGGIDLHLEVLTTTYTQATNDLTTQGEILARIQKEVFGDAQEGIIPHTGICGYFNSPELGKETVRLWDSNPSTPFAIMFEVDDGMLLTDANGTPRRKFLHVGTNTYGVTFEDRFQKILKPNSAAHMIPRLVYGIHDSIDDATVDLFAKDAGTGAWSLVTDLSKDIGHEDLQLSASLRNFVFLWETKLFLGRADDQDTYVSNNEKMDELLVRTQTSYTSLKDSNIISMDSETIHDDIKVYFKSKPFSLRHSTDLVSWPNEQIVTLTIQMNAIPKVADTQKIARDDVTHILSPHEHPPVVKLQLKATVTLDVSAPNAFLVRGGTFTADRVIPGSLLGTDGDYASYRDPDLMAPYQATFFNQNSYQYEDNSGSVDIDVQETAMQKNKLSLDDDGFKVALSMFMKAKTGTDELLNDNLLSTGIDDNSWLESINFTDSQVFVIVPDNLTEHQVIDGENNNLVNSFVEKHAEDAAEEVVWGVEGDQVHAQRVDVKWHSSQATTYLDGKYHILVVPNTMLGDATVEAEATAVVFTIKPRTLDGLCKMQNQTMGNVLRAKFHVVPLIKTQMEDKDSNPSTFAVYTRIPVLFHVRAHDFIAGGKNPINLTFVNETFENNRFTFAKGSSTGLLEFQFLAMPAVEDDQQTPSFEFEIRTLNLFTGTTATNQFSIRPKDPSAPPDHGLATTPDRLFVGGQQIAAAAPHVFSNTQSSSNALVVGGLDMTPDGANGRRTYRIRTVWTVDTNPDPVRHFLMRVKSVNILQYQNENDDASILTLESMFNGLTSRKAHTFGAMDRYSSCLLNWTNDPNEMGGNEITATELVNEEYEFQAQISSFERSSGVVASENFDSAFMRQFRVVQSFDPTNATPPVFDNAQQTTTNPSSGMVLSRPLASVSERIWAGICPMKDITGQIVLHLDVVAHGKNTVDQDAHVEIPVYTSYTQGTQITSTAPISINALQTWYGGWLDFSQVTESLKVLEYATVHAVLRNASESVNSIIPKTSDLSLFLGQVDLSGAGTALLEKLENIAFTHLRIGNWVLQTDSAGDLSMAHRVWLDNMEASTEVDSTMRATVTAKTVEDLKDEMGKDTPGAVHFVATDFRLTGHLNE